MNTADVYEDLYINMKNKFTVTNGDCEYSLGDFMRMKASANTKASNLPAVRTPAGANRIAAVFSYVNDKLTVKKAPIKDKTIRAFPFRTSAAAFLSAVVACAMIFSYGLFSVRNSGTTTQPIVEAGEISEDIEITEGENN